MLYFYTLWLTNLDLTIGIQKDIVALDISVDNVLCMKMLQATACLWDVVSCIQRCVVPLTHLEANGGNLFLRDDRVVVNHVRQRTTLHVLHNNP